MIIWWIENSWQRNMCLVYELSFNQSLIECKEGKDMTDYW